jgi:hypothetical protein
VVRVPGYRFKGPVFDSRRYQIFLEIVGLGPLSLVSTIEELFGRNSSGSDLENIDTAARIRQADVTRSICKELALTSPTSAVDRSV